MAFVASAASAAVVVPTGFADQVLVGSGLDQPRAFALLPDGRALVMEHKSGKIHLVVNGHLSPSDPVFTVADVDPNGYERGTQGITVDPAFPARPYVYVSYDDWDLHIHLTRYTVTGSVNDPAGTSLTFGGQREILSDMQHQSDSHNGGCLRFGPDGMLYWSLGDNEQSCTAQDSTLLHGCIVRLDVSRVPSGAGAQPVRALITPTGNPLSTPDSNAKLVWAYGLRNPWCFGMDPYTGLIYCADVGEETQEELDEIHGGRNYGFPYREGNAVLPDTGCAAEPGGGGNPANGFGAPIAAFTRDQSLHAIFTAGIYRPVQPAAGVVDWPAAYRGNVFYGDYYVGALKRIVRDPISNVWGAAVPVPGQPDPLSWGTGFVSAVDFVVGPDGAMWWLQQFDASGSPGTGSLHRLVYIGADSSVDPASAVLRLSAGPNPFTASTELAFALPAAGRASLVIYDLSGRRVATLFAGTAPAGETRRAWDGHDARGARAPAGVYLARLESASGVQTLRMLRLR